jgi:hypothetical protein
MLDILGVTYPLAKPAKHLLAVNAFATVKAVNALQQLCFQFLKGLGFQRRRYIHDESSTKFTPLAYYHE